MEKENTAISAAIKEMEEYLFPTEDINGHRNWHNSAIVKGIRVLRGLQKDVVDVRIVEELLKETYLEVANTYDVSDLHHDGDKVSCVASKFRQTMLDKLKGRMS